MNVEQLNAQLIDMQKAINEKAATSELEKVKGMMVFAPKNDVKLPAIPPIPQHPAANVSISKVVNKGLNMTHNKAEMILLADSNRKYIETKQLWKNAAKIKVSTAAELGSIIEGYDFSSAK